MKQPGTFYKSFLFLVIEDFEAKLTLMWGDSLIFILPGGCLLVSTLGPLVLEPVCGGGVLGRVLAVGTPFQLIRTFSFATWDGHILLTNWICLRRMRNCTRKRWEVVLSLWIQARVPAFKSWVLSSLAL